MRLENNMITVVGAGIGGLAIAILLRQAGASVRVLEQAEAISEVGAGLQISPNGVAVLRAMGVLDDLAWNATRARAVVLRRHRKGREVVRLDLDQYASDLRYYFVHRADLVELLAAKARDVGVQIRLLQRVDRVDPSGAPKLYLANGSCCHGDLVIGADGVRSRLRDAINGVQEPFFTGQVAWRALVPNRLKLENEAQLFMGPGRHLVAYPLRDGSLINLVAVQEQRTWVEESWSLKDDPDNLRRAFANFGGTAHELLSDVQEVGFWGLFRHNVAEKWHAGRLVLIGDAAHPTLPFMAQGANMALEDAYVLADSLTRAETLEGALTRYQSRRRERVSKVVDTANGNAWRYHLRPPISWPAHLLMRAMSQWAPQKMVGQFDWIYRHDVTEGQGLQGARSDAH
ncbi:MAG: FAD-dependent monooxygenase [Epibacterium sp.]|nr:FAD-dependent monooxygenase [Epibacterium sp.]NQX72405.1 FAD-dependent monooxygenase [Epibacterium sp.]